VLKSLNALLEEVFFLLFYRRARSIEHCIVVIANSETKEEEEEAQRFRKQKHSGVIAHPASPPHPTTTIKLITPTRFT
jgi:hypothetical protein